MLQKVFKNYRFLIGLAIIASVFVGFKTVEAIACPSVRNVNGFTLIFTCDRGPRMVDATRGGNSRIGAGYSSVRGQWQGSFSNNTFSAATQRLIASHVASKGANKTYVFWRGQGGNHIVNGKASTHIGYPASRVCRYLRTLDNGCSRVAPVDLCSNMIGDQTTIPAGMRDTGGGRCELIPTRLEISCRASKNPVLEQEVFTFTVTPIAQAPGSITYEWSTDDGDVFKVDTSAGNSNYVTSYATSGIYQLHVKATDSRNNTDTKSCAISVADLPEPPPPPFLRLEGAKITNEFCDLEWKSSRVENCKFLDIEGLEEGVTATGTRQVTSGIYKVICNLESNITEILETEWVDCVNNINFREM